jgi:hypothetical protein
MQLRLLLLLAVLLLSGCGSSHVASATRTSSHDWTRFGYDAARTAVAPRGISAAGVAKLRQRRIALPGTVDASPVYLGGVTVGGKRRDIIVMTTTYGRTLALDAGNGKELWRFQPPSYARVAGSAQITTATPVADRRFVYAASPDGRIHKLSLAGGREAGGAWPVSVTRDATHEKIASALNLSGRHVLVTTGGYVGDAPPYQGKVVSIDRGSGRIASVFNSLCSDRRTIIRPSTCAASDSAIWGRAGAVVNPANRHVLVTTSNGPFDGRTNWGDSVLELSAGAGRLLRHWTPHEQAALERGDIDLGSSAPALLPDPRSGRPRFLLQGGKGARLHLLALRGSLHGVTGAAGPRTGGERQVVDAPGRKAVFTAIAVLHRRGLTLAFVTTNAGTAAFRLTGGRLESVWSNATPGTSPVLAGGVLWVYDPTGGLVAYQPRTGRPIHRFTVPPGHWNSPIVAGGRVYLPTGDANDHDTSGSLSVFGAG